MDSNSRLLSSNELPALSHRKAKDNEAFWTAQSIDLIRKKGPQKSCRSRPCLGELPSHSHPGRKVQHPRPLPLPPPALLSADWHIPPLEHCIISHTQAATCRRPLSSQPAEQVIQACGPSPCFCISLQFKPVAQATDSTSRHETQPALALLACSHRAVSRARLTGTRLSQYN